MFVVITNSDKSTQWYHTLVGSTVEVADDRDDDYFSVIEEEPEEPWLTYLIKKENAQVID